jgi:tRNA uridine 5-carbamoylmethylation protein Kti12
MSLSIQSQLVLPPHVGIEFEQDQVESRRKTSLPRLLLIRGLPGSGKSTLAKSLERLEYVHFEADMFFMKAGRYQYDASRIRDAHAWCRSMTRSALARGRRVVVANTFTRVDELSPYMGMEPDCVVVHTCGRWSNQHGVPAEVVQRMAARWEPMRPKSRLQHAPIG